MPWIDLRRDIGDMFADLSPTQWTALFTGWMFKPLVFWDDRGDRSDPGTPSRTYSWHQGKARAQESREHRARVRRINRYTSIQKRMHCSGCGAELDHSEKQNIRKYCTPECQRLFLRKRRHAIERENECRHCEICGALFIVDKHMKKKTCGDECRKERNRRRRRKKRS